MANVGLLNPTTASGCRSHIDTVNARRNQRAWLLVAALIFIYIDLCLLLPHGKGPLLEKPGTSYWPIPGGLQLLMPAHSALSISLVTFVYCILSSLVGSVVFEKIGGIRVADATLRFSVGFLTGYVFAIAIGRLFSTFLVNWLATALIMALMILMAAAQVISIWNSRNSSSKETPTERGAIVAFAALIVLFYVLQVQQGATHVVGDGVGLFIDIINHDHYLDLYGYFPIVADRHDEIMYFYPLLVALRPRNPNFIDMAGVLYAVAKATIFVTLFHILRTRLENSLVVLLICFFLFFGTLNLNFLDWQELLFDTGNPLSVNLHPGRLLLDLMPFALLIGGGLARQNRNFGIRSVLIFLVGIGLSTFTASSIFVLFPVLLASWGLRVIGVTRVSLMPLSDMLILLVGFTVAMATLGNMPAVDFYHYIGVKNLDVVSRWIRAPSFTHFGENPFCGTFPHLYCGSLTALIGSFGLTLLFAIIAIFGTVVRRGSLTSPNHYPTELAVFWVALAGFVCTMFLYLYMNGGIPQTEEGKYLIWYKSRIVEPWFYAVVGFSALVAFKMGNSVLRRFVVALMILLVIGSNFNDFKGGVFFQLFNNSNFLISRLASLLGLHAIPLISS